MSQHRILSIDTAYDRILTLFSANRKRYYQALNDDEAHHVTQLTGYGANRDSFLEQCEITDASGAPFFNCLTISSHGSSGVIYNRKFGQEVTLLSVDDADDIFKLVGNGRLIYLLACKTADGNLLNKLKENSAKTVIGFSEKPSWGSAAGNKLWRAIDTQILSCFVAPDFKVAVNETITEMMKSIESDLLTASVQYTRDLKKIRKVLASTVII